MDRAYWKDDDMKVSHFICILLPLLGCSHGTPAVHEAQSVKTREQQTLQTRYTHHSLAEIKKQTASPEKKVKNKVLLNVPLIKQNPELRYGCEVTSLAMVMKYAGVNTNKMTLYRQIKKDHDPLRMNKGNITSWGNPEDGFVGDMTGRHPGYAVFEKPMIDLINHYLPGRAVNLTGKHFDSVQQHVSRGFPVVMWTTGDYKLPDRPESWAHGKTTIKTPLDLHAVVLVGYDSTNLYLNDPLSGRKQVKVNKQQFIQTWKAMQSRAVSYE